MSACELAVSSTCPNINNKRVLEDSGNNQSDKNNLQQQQGVAAASGAADAAVVVVSKRRRGGGASTGGSSSAARCFVQAAASTPACAAGPTTLSALCALFPEMAEQVRRKIEFLRRLSIPPFASRCSISFFYVSQPRPPLPSNFSLSLLQDVADVLYSCGDDIDAAVRRLSELRLRPDGTAVILEKGHGSGEEENDDGRVEAACSSAAAAAAAAASGRATPDLLPPSGPGSEAARSGAASPGPPPAAGGGERKSVENGNGVASCARQGSDPSTSAAAASASPAEVDAWADGLVREMAAASDVGDAKARASTVLRGFESALLHRVAAAAAAAEASPSGNNSGNVASAAATAARAAALERDCSLLKCAVALQASRLQGAAQARRQESLALSRALHEARARVQQLELTNFALAAHLRAATDGGAGGVGGGGGFGGGGGSSHGGGRGGAAGGMNGLGGQGGGGGGFASPSRDVY